MIHYECIDDFILLLFYLILLLNKSMMIKKVITGKKHKASLYFASMWVQNQTLLYSHTSIFNATCTEPFPCDKHSHRTAHPVCRKPSRHIFKTPDNGGCGGDGGVTVSKYEKYIQNKTLHPHYELDNHTTSTSPPPCFLSLSSPQALWRDKSPPRHSCTMESIDDPLTDSQKPSTNTTNTTLPPPTTPPQQQQQQQQLHPNPGPAKAGSNTSSYRAPRASWRQQGTTESPWTPEIF